MYLVFIAMLAMQMDRKVLSSFGYSKEKTEDANRIASKNNGATLKGLADKASEQPDKFGELNQKAQKINQLSNEFYTYIKELKAKIYEGLSDEDKGNYEAQSNSDKVDELFFIGDKPRKDGKEFVDAINNYKKSLLELLGDKASDEIKTNINKRFNTDDEEIEGVKVDWLVSRYQGMPLITTISNLTQIQSDIKTTEQEVYSALVSGKLESEVSMSNYTGVVKLDKTAFYVGEKVTGSVVLGRYDPTLKPTRVEFNGNKNYKNFKDGSVVIDMTASSVGDKPIKGTIFFTEKGKEVPVQFESTYSVIPRPNEAVISADKMNVVYKGLSNPLTISIPGVPSNKVKATAPGLRHIKGDNYVMRPVGSGVVSINVTGTMVDGKTVRSVKKFRIKDIPHAVTMVRGQYEKISLPKSSVAGITVGAGLPDFLFDLKLNVSSFKMKVSGQVTVPVNGTRMSPRAQAAIRKARRGDQVTIFDVKATVSGSGGYVVRKVLPIIINVSN